MTLLLGLEHRGRCHLLGDRISIDSDSAVTIVREPKIFRSGEWLIGIAGSWRVGNLAQLKLRAPRSGSPVELFEALAAVLTAAGYASPSGPDTDVPWEALAGFRGQLHYLDADGTCTRSADGITAAGHNIGASAARAALAAQRPFRRSPELVMRKAAQISADGCAAVRGPFDYLTETQACT